MFNLAVDFSALAGSFHIQASLLGAIVYLGYTMLPTLRLLIQSRSLGLADPNCSDKELKNVGLCSKIKFTPRNLAGAGSIVFLLIGLALTAHNKIVDRVDPTCPLEVEGLYAVSPSTQNSQASQPAPSLNAATHANGRGNKFIGRITALTARKEQVELPTVLLARAHETADPMSSSSQWPVLEACAAWAPSEGMPAIPELHAQLKCNARLVQSGAITREASPAVLSRARQLMVSLRAQAGAAAEPSALLKVEAEWAQITHNLFQLSCKAVSDDLQMSRRAKPSAPSPEQPQRSPVVTLLDALNSLKKMEAPFRENLAALAEGIKVLEPRSLDNDEAAGELQTLRDSLGADRACALQALQEGRSLAMAMPKKSPLVKRAMQCHPQMLGDFQALVLREAAEAKDAASLFGLGSHYSDMGLATESGKSYAPLFEAGPQTTISWRSSEPAWAADAGGSHAPSNLVQAEALMLAGEEASPEAERSDRAAARALRLYQHAKMLALKHHDTAAEWRYRASAEVAAAHRRQKLAAHALGRLGYFLSLRGRKEEALEVAGMALTHFEEDPLAQYLQISLRRSLGELKTNEEVQAAEKLLESVAGKMPSKTLEEERARAQADFGWWRLVATEGLQVCLRAWDAAQMLICLFSGLMYELPGVAEVAAP